jgi:hypothetical protein
VRLLKIAKKILIPSAVLIASFLVIGMGYSLITSQPDSKTPPAKPAKSQDIADIGDIKPVKPGPNAPEGVSTYLFETSVKAGTNAGVTAHTLADSACTVSVTYNDVASQDSGLAAKKADAYGTVNWTWTVPAGTPAGTWPVKVACVRNGHSGVSVSNLSVVR